ncbi:MAG: hypothetical protein JST16_03040 [Bdellovibrionales bacterium]|nr:hypothetical protein [Bdellovibrionales bacterium]
MKRYFLFRRAACATGVLVLFAACGKLSFDDPSDPLMSSPSTTAPSATPQVGSAEVGDLSASLRELPEPNRFEVALSWSPEPDVSAYIVKRKDNHGQIAQLDLLPGAAKSFSDSSVEPQNRYVYSVVGMRDGAVLESREAVIETPLDLEVASAVDWPASEITGINRLFLRKGARLRTLGRDFRIDVRAIIADDAVIESFPEGRAAPLGAAGSHGGSLDLKATTGAGSLLILARGENGGAGLAGARGGMGPVGARGGDGVADYETDCTLLSLSRLAIGDHGHCFKHWYCKRETGDGAQGGRGAAGAIGGSGFAGGDSMSVTVDVAEAKDLSFRYEKLPGLGGPGGPGGPGGAGGPGGPPGSRDSGGRCRVAQFGPTGPVGPQGPNGPSGSSGEARPVCLSLSGTKIGDC